MSKTTVPVPLAAKIGEYEITLGRYVITPGYGTIPLTTHPGIPQHFRTFRTRHVNELR